MNYCGVPSSATFSSALHGRRREASGASAATSRSSSAAPRDGRVAGARAARVGARSIASTSCRLRPSVWSHSRSTWSCRHGYFSRSVACRPSAESIDRIFRREHHSGLWSSSIGFTTYHAGCATRSGGLPSTENDSAVSSFFYSHTNRVCDESSSSRRSNCFPFIRYAFRWTISFFRWSSLGSWGSSWYSHSFSLASMSRYGFFYRWSRSFPMWHRTWSFTESSRTNSGSRYGHCLHINSRSGVPHRSARSIYRYSLRGKPHPSFSSDMNSLPWTISHQTPESFRDSSSFTSSTIYRDETLVNHPWTRVAPLNKTGPGSVLPWFRGDTIISRVQASSRSHARRSRTHHRSVLLANLSCRSINGSLVDPVVTNRRQATVSRGFDHTLA